MSHVNRMILFGTVAETYNGQQFDLLVGETYINIFVPDDKQAFVQKWISKGKSVYVEGEYTDEGGTMPGCKIDKVQFV